jgi:Ca-activated chloride channel family protein
MKRLVAAVVVAAVCWLPGISGTGEAEGQVMWPGPPPPQFGSRLVGVSEAGGSTALPIVDEQINVDIDGQNASTRLRQTFYNRTGDRIEGLYSLYAGVGVKADGFAYWNGEQKIVGEVFERGVARQVYQNVTRRRRDPGLLEETGDGVFSFAVSPIEPGERKRVEVSYSQWLPRRAATVELRAPVTRPDTDVTVTIADGRELREITSPTHQIDVQRQSTGRYLVRARKALAPTAELLLRYQIVDRPWTVGGYIHRDKDQDAYFMLTVAAPELPASATVAKDVTLVIDRSGSMSGEKIRQARAACIDIVKRLRSDDRLNVLEFDDRVEQLFPEPQPVSEAIRRQATEYLEMLDDGGGTNIAWALERALRAQAKGGDRPRVVLFFTDGQSEVPPVLAAAQADKRDVRVFTVGFGPDVNRPLLARLAAGKRGRFTYIPAAANIEREVSLLYRQIDAPVLVDVSLETAGGAITRLYPPSMPDLFVDDELRVSGRLRASGPGPVTFTIKGKQGGRPVALLARVEGKAEIARPWVARRWAGARIEDLVDEIALGGTRPELETEIIDLALAYNFATPYTAFLAIPASELDAVSAHQIASARGYKAEILRRKPDAAHVAGGGGGAADRVDMADDVLESGNAARPMTHQRTMAANEGEESPLSEISDVRPLKKSTPGRGGARQEPGGCASCAVGGHGNGALAGLVLAGLVMVVGFGRRRRR